MKESLSSFEAVSVFQVSPTTCTVMIRGNAVPKTREDGEICHECDTYIIEDVPGQVDAVKAAYEEVYEAEFQRLHSEETDRATYIASMQAAQEARDYLDDTDYKVIKAMEQGKTLDELYPGESGQRETARQAIRDFEALTASMT